MPNTLAHLGVHAVLTRGAIPRADLSAVWLGYLLPDLPWILQRAAKLLPFHVTPVDLRLYATVQSALFFCLIGAAIPALLARRPWRLFGIVGLGCLIHLLLDASQIKWANGVLLIAPFDWHLLNFGFYWPEDPMTMWLSAFGFGIVVLAAIRMPPTPLRLSRPRPHRLAGAVFAIVVYVLGPLAFLAPAESADVHFTGTLRETEHRKGRDIGFDRSDLVIQEGGATFLDIWTGERLRLTDVPDGLESGKASVQGHFVDATSVQVESLHWHPARQRQFLTYAGLGIILGWWGWALVLGMRRPPTRSSE